MENDLTDFRTAVAISTDSESLVISFACISHISFSCYPSCRTHFISHETYGDLPHHLAQNSTKEL